MSIQKKLHILFSILVCAALLVSCAAPTLSSQTPIPTLQAVGTASNTPKPTSTLRPSLTPVPSATPTLTATPIPTPDPNGPPLASSDATMDLNNFGPSQPFSVRFNFPMDPKSAQTPLQVYPDLPGSQDWSADDTTLTFKPATHFAPGEDYYLFLDRDLKDSRGRSFEQVQQWKIHASPAPRVVQRSPDRLNPTELLPSYDLTFDRAMDRASVQKAFCVVPAAVVKLTWAPSKLAPGEVLTVAVQKPLTTGQTYVFTLGTGATGLDGLAMAAEYHWTQATDSLYASINSLMNTGIEFGFNYPLDVKDPAKTFALDPPLSGKWEWSSNSQLRFVADDRLAYATQYTLKASGPLVSLDGTAYPSFEAAAQELPAPVRFDRDDTFRLENMNEPAPVNFDIPMDPASTDAAISVSPSTPITFEWQDQNKTLLIHPSGLWPARIEMTFTIGTGAADTNHRPVLSKPFTFSFGDIFYLPEQMYPMFASLGTRFQAVDANGRRAIQFVNQNKAATATVGLAPLSLGDFARRYSLYLKDNPETNYWGYSFDNSAFNGLIPQKTWPITLNASSIQELVIPPDVPPGLYAISITDNPQYTDYMFLDLTTRLLTVKGGAGRVYTWTTDFSGQPAPGMEVRLYGEQGAHLLDGQSDENGLWSAPVSSGVNVTLALAISGQPQGISLSGDVAAAALDSSFATPYSQPNWSYYDSDSSREGSSSARAYIYTDRPIYQPGQTVNFKLILRSELDARYSLPPEGTLAKVSIIDSKSNPVQTYNLALDAFGTASASFTLANGAMLGSYKITVDALGETASQTFEVQDYKKPEFEVTLTPSATNVVGGDKVTVDVDVRYFTGQPVVGAALAFSTFESYYYSYMYGSDVWWPTDDKAPSGGVTDANGHFQTTVAIPVHGYYDYYDQAWLLQVDVTDPAGLAVSQGTRFNIHPALESVRLDYPTGYRTQTGQPYSESMQVTDLNGSPVAGRDLSAKLTYERWFQDKNTVADQSAAITTDSAGRAVVTFMPVTDGWYELEIDGTDPQGNVYRDWDYFYATSSAATTRSDTSPLAISVDKSQAEPFDTVNIRIESDFGGPALLTFERGSVLRALPITLTPPLTTVTQQLDGACIPNVFIKVSAWVPSDTLTLFNGEVGQDPYSFVTLPEANLRSAKAEVQVDTASRQLKVEITPGQPEYLPGQEATFQLKVTDADGQPARAEVSLAVVDEAIFSLQSDPARPILDAFYGLRDDTTGSYDEMAPERWMFNPGPAGGGGGGPASASPRTQFSDTALWLPDIVTDPNGEADVKVILPDNITKWRVTARAVTVDTLVGQAQASFITARPLIVRPLLPTSLTQGDRSELGALVSNTTSQNQDVAVSFQASPATALELVGPGTQSITLQPGETQMVSWTVTAGIPADAQVTMTALSTSGEAGDAIRLPLTVQPLSTLFAQTTSGTLGGPDGASLEFTLPLALPPRWTGDSKVTITLTRSVSASLVKGLGDLTRYPYGCVEQIMSAALPNAVVARAFARLGAPEELNPDLGGMINDGLQRLYAMQHGDGGWGWWFDDATDVYMTSWVLLGLSLTRQAGYQVADSVTDPAVDYLQKYDFSKDSPATEAFARYSLAVAGKGDVQATLALAGSSSSLDAFSLSALALALHIEGEEDAANHILDHLLSGLVERSGMAYFPIYNQDGEYENKTMSSAVRSTALAMEALIQIRPADARIAELESYLMSERKDFGWGSTNETSFSILALTSRLEQEQNDPRPAAYSLALNGGVRSEGKLEAGDAPLTLEIPAYELVPGGNLLHLATQPGGSPLYYTITSRMSVPEVASQPDGSIQVERTYVMPSGKSMADLKPGDRVEVELTLVLSDETHYLLLEDNLPGGLEAINENLNTTGPGDRTEANGYSGYTYTYADLGYNQKEIRGSQVLFFISDAHDGVTNISYWARVTRPGSYQALPAQASAMYDGSQWGRSSSTLLEITP